MKLNKDALLFIFTTFVFSNRNMQKNHINEASTTNQFNGKCCSFIVLHCKLTLQYGRLSLSQCLLLKSLIPKFTILAGTDSKWIFDNVTKVRQDFEIPKDWFYVKPYLGCLHEFISQACIWHSSKGDEHSFSQLLWDNVRRSTDQYECVYVT